jgi:hypothetical protein
MKEQVEGSLPERQKPERTFSELRTSELLNGIESGTITNPSAVRVLIGKQLEAERQIYSGEHRREIDQRYARLINGNPQNLTQYCQQRADRAMTFSSPVASDSTHYAAAKHWYQMAARFAHETATTGNVQEHSSSPTNRMIFNQPGELPASPVETASNILDGIENGMITSPGAVVDLSIALLKTDRQTLHGDLLKQREAAYAPLIVGSPKETTQFCVSEATSLMGSDVPGSLHVNFEAAARWYEMAARSAHQAQRDRDSDTESSDRAKQAEYPTD